MRFSWLAVGLVVSFTTTVQAFTDDELQKLAAAQRLVEKVSAEKAKAPPRVVERRKDRYIGLTKGQEHRALMVKFADENSVRVRNGRFATIADVPSGQLLLVLDRINSIAGPKQGNSVIAISRLFAESEEDLDRVRIYNKMGSEVPNLNSFYVIQFEDGATPQTSQALAKRLAEYDEIESLYFESTPVLFDATPNFNSDTTWYHPQKYLWQSDSTPGNVSGINAVYAWGRNSPR